MPRDLPRCPRGVPHPPGRRRHPSSQGEDQTSSDYRGRLLLARSRRWRENAGIPASRLRQGRADPEAGSRCATVAALALARATPTPPYG